jgi:2-(3-amino-3-carboxypropyl)histidine synthase
MKTLFIPAKVKFELDESKVKDVSKKLPKNLVIAYSIQFKENAEKIKDILSKKHNIVSFIQVLGCSKPKFSKPVQAILLIGSGKFHAVSLAYEAKKPVFILEKDSLTKVSKEEIGKFERKKKASYVNYLNSKNTGILVSTKPGQENLKKALELSKKIKDKETYIFLSNNIDAGEFENFGLDSYINTSCPRLDMDSIKIINMESLRRKS